MIPMDRLIDIWDHGAVWLRGREPDVMELERFQRHADIDGSSRGYLSFPSEAGSELKSRDNGWERENACSRRQSHLSHLCQLQ